MVALPERSQPTVAAIYRSYEEMSDSGFRPHLGASVLGRECERELWLTFRWVSKRAFEGRMLRLFDTGNWEEQRLVADLRRIGVTIHEVDPDTGDQFVVSSHGGHAGGSMDGAAVGFPEAPKAWHVTEFKTHNAKSYAKLKKEGVRKAKPEHWSQMQTYMHHTGMDRAMYLAVNKDTDEIYSERIHYDGEAALGLQAKAARVIFSPKPLERISRDPSWFGCRYCDHRDNCHGSKLPEVSCRTCLHSTPEQEGGWTCARWSKALTVEEQKTGCGAHLFVPDLIAGEVKDAGDDFVEYAMRDGTTWRDGRKAIAA